MCPIREILLCCLNCSSVSFILVNSLRSKTMLVHIISLPNTAAIKILPHAKWLQPGRYVSGDDSFRCPYSVFSRWLTASGSCRVAGANRKYPTLLPTARKSFREFQNLALALMFLMEVAGNISKLLKREASTRFSWHPPTSLSFYISRNLYKTSWGEERNNNANLIWSSNPSSYTLLYMSPFYRISQKLVPHQFISQSVNLILDGNPFLKELRP